MELFFTIDQRLHGKGPIIYKWNPQGSLVASSGSSRVVQLFDSNGEMVDQVVPPSPSVVMALEWDKNGVILAIMQDHSPIIVLWHSSTKSSQQLDVGVKDLTLLSWSRTGPQLAIGTGKGSVTLYNSASGERCTAQARHKKRILCGAWNKENRFAYGSEDKQITICDARGATLDQMNIKSRPLDIAFGGRTVDNEGTVSVNMEGKTILLYNMNERENALELAFQPKYGTIVCYRWFGDGYILAGFASGFVIMISTHISDIGKEQMSAKFHSDSMRDIAPFFEKAQIATCNGDTLKIVDLKSWKELTSESIAKEAGLLDKIQWAADGAILSVSSRSGCLYNFFVTSNKKQPRLFPPADSMMVYTLGSLLPLEMVATVSVVLLVLLFGTVYGLQVSLRDLLSAIFSLHAVI